MGNEGIGVYCVLDFMKKDLPENVECLDGGTGSFTLLGPMQEADKVIIIDATINGKPSGTVDVTYPEFSSDYPTTLTAHDIGLKDLLDVFYILGDKPDMALITVSIPSYGELSTSLTQEMTAIIPEVSAKIYQELHN